jgi:hypothetical protein
LLVPLPQNEFAAVIDSTPPGGLPVVSDRRGVSNSLSRHRLRFRLAHEIAHTLFYRRSPRRQPRRRLFDSPGQERFCDTFARVLLVPRSRVKRSGSGVEDILRIQQTCDVSLELGARAFADRHRDLVVALWWESRAGVLERQWCSDKGWPIQPTESRGDIRQLESRNQVLAVMPRALHAQ